MSMDDNFAHNELDVPLETILRSRNGCLDKSEVWAILKETCVALKQLQYDIKFPRLKLDINCLIIDESGNIKVDVEEFSNVNSMGKIARHKGTLINSLGEMFKQILLKYSDVNEKENLFTFVENLGNSTSDDQFSIHHIELYADRQLNVSSTTDALYNDSNTNSKTSDELTSTLQDSFMMVECSSGTEEDIELDHSTGTDRYIVYTDENSSSTAYEESKYFVSLNDLWGNCLDPLFRSDREVLVFIYVLLTEVSDTVLNKENNNQCLCLSPENILLNPLGKILIRLSCRTCDGCQKEKPTLPVKDNKFVRSVGAMMYEITQSDQRIRVSEHTTSFLFRMRQATNMTIKSVLDFCKANPSFRTIKCRHVLRCLFDLWNHWYNVHLNYLMNLKHKYLYDISTKALTKTLKPISTKGPCTVLQFFQQDPASIRSLKYVTKIPKTPLLSYMPNFRDVVRTHSSSAFRPYNARKASFVCLKPESASRISDSTHFRPLVLSSERHSIHYSKEQILSPIDVSPKYSYDLQDGLGAQSTMSLNTSKTWRSDNHLSVNDQVTGNKAQENGVPRVVTGSNKSSKINLIIEVIEAELLKSLKSDVNEIGDRQLLGVADFALSLDGLSKDIFSEAMKQRFTHIRWSEEALGHLHHAIRSKDTKAISINENKDLKDTGKLKENMCISNELIMTPGPKETISSKNQGNYSSASGKYESFEEYEPTAISPKSPSFSYRKDKLEDLKNNKRYTEHFYANIVQNTNVTSDSDGTLIKTLEAFPNKLQSKFSFQSSEDTLFYYQIYPITLLCFPSTLIYTNKGSTEVPDQMINGHKIQELLLTFQEINKNIRKKFRDFSRITELISKTDYFNRNGPKMRKRVINEQKNIQLDLESLILKEMKIENTIVEYHSVSLETILGDGESDLTKQHVIFYQDLNFFQNLQFVRPSTLVSCLFARGAVSSGLMYEFFLVYREFFSTKNFIECLKIAFENIISKLQNWSLLVTKARFRLLYIILCWIEGFYDVDISESTLTYLHDLSSTHLVPFIKNANEIIENAVATARSSKTSLSIQFTALNRRINVTTDTVHNVDIHSLISRMDSLAKEKRNFLKTGRLSSSLGLGYKDTFSIINTSPKELAVCLTLMQQSYFNYIHPCHLLLYLKSLNGNNESILKSIINDRFSLRKHLSLDHGHKEIHSILQFSGQITEWATSEILLTTDVKSQSRIVKKLILTCLCCKELNNYGTMASISEALSSERLKWASFWTHVSAKTLKTFRDISGTTSKLFNSTIGWPDGHESSSNALLSGVPFLPCIHAIIMHLKMSSFGTCVARNGCLKWSKLRKLSKIIDQVRLYKQFRYTTVDQTTKELLPNLKSRIEHLSSIYKDLEQTPRVFTRAR